jgi:hypothetical protein
MSGRGSGFKRWRAATQGRHPHCRFPKPKHETGVLSRTPVFYGDSQNNGGKTVDRPDYAAARLVHGFSTIILIIAILLRKTSLRLSRGLGLTAKMTDKDARVIAPKQALKTTGCTQYVSKCPTFFGTRALSALCGFHFR